MMVGLEKKIKYRTTLFYRYNFLLPKMNGLSDLNSFRRVPFERCTYSCYWSIRSSSFESEKTLLSSSWWGFFPSSNLFISFLQLKMQVNMFLYCARIHSDFYKKQMFWASNLNHIVKKHPFTHFLSSLSSLGPLFYFQFLYYSHIFS